MSETPICDFVNEYVARKPVRFHMPGHKGKGSLGCETRDLTEIDGADALFEASGIIAESEKNASALFGCPTYYSTEGSSLCIRAMLYLASTCGRGKTVLAARNVHKSFIYAAALLDLDVRWLCPDGGRSLLTATILPRDVEKALDGMDEKPACVYLTCPDYLGCGCDLKGIAEVCHKRGVLLLVDGAHAAYLKFLSKSLHPIDCGADLVCCSAHKTLPVLTGGAYLHIGNAVAERFCPRAKEAMALFGSTSPSYLILQSLDAANAALTDYAPRMEALSRRAFALKLRLRQQGYELCQEKAVLPGLPGFFQTAPAIAFMPGGDPCRIAIAPKSYGYTGDKLAAILEKQNVYPEFQDPDYLVLMLTPENDERDFSALEKALLSLPRRAPIEKKAPRLPTPERVMSVREAIFSPCEKVPAEQALGRVLHDPSVSCPPAVPILMPGERIDEAAVSCFAYYGVKACGVVR